MRSLTTYWPHHHRLASNLWNDMDRLLGDFSEVRPDVSETETHFLISADMPGIRKEDIKIEVANNILHIFAERKTGRTQRTFKKSYSLPNAVSTDKIEAHYEDGVLELSLPKTEMAQAKKIEIQTGKGGFFEKLLSSKKSESES